MADCGLAAMDVIGTLYRLQPVLLSAGQIQPVSCYGYGHSSGQTHPAYQTLPAARGTLHPACYGFAGQAGSGAQIFCHHAE